MIKCQRNALTSGHGGRMAATAISVFGTSVPISTVSRRDRPFWIPRPVGKASQRVAARYRLLYPRIATLPRSTRRRLQRILGTSLSGVVLALALAHSPTVSAAEIPVTTDIPHLVADDGLCSLTEAIENANLDQGVHSDCVPGDGEDVIVLEPGSVHALSGTFAGLPAILGVLTIEGNGAVIAHNGPGAAELRIVENRGDLTLNETTVTGGEAIAPAAFPGPGIAAYGQAGGTCRTQLNNSTVSRSYGGVRSEYCDLTLNGSTLSGNGEGGAYSLMGNVTLNNSTVSGNSGNFSPGLWNQLGTLTLNNSTVVGNEVFYGTAGVLNSGTLIARNSIISGNLAFDSHGLALEIRSTGAAVSEGYNLLGTENLTTERAVGGFDLHPADITATSDGVFPMALTDMLDPILADNGGPTQTHALVSGSPAADAAGNCPPPDSDQRGVSRPQGGGCDIGAFEQEVMEGPDLVIEHATSAVADDEGWTVTYVFNVVNRGPLGATEVSMLDTIPPMTDGDFLSIPEQCVMIHAEVAKCVLGDLPSGASTQFEIVVRPWILTDGRVFNRAAVRSLEPDMDVTSNRATIINMLE